MLKNKILIISVMTLFVLACNANTDSNLVVTANKLNAIQLEIKEHPNNGYNYISFFDEFPNNFNSLKAIYGYNTHDSEDTAAILYKEYESHIPLFFASKKHINDTAFLQKSILVSIGGKWEADAIGMFQHLLYDEVVQNIRIVNHLLMRLPDSDIYSFWYFYLDGPHPQKQTPSLASYKSLDKNIYLQLERAYADVIRDNEH